jgi:hypothetical protein
MGCLYERANSAQVIAVGSWIFRGLTRERSMRRAPLSAFIFAGNFRVRLAKRRTDAGGDREHDAPILL